MAKLYFRYGAMSSGKSEQLVSIAMNYKVQGKRVVVFSPTADTRASASSGVVKSRNGAEWPSIRVSPEANLHSEFLTATKTDENRPVCVLVDEAQFLTREQVMSLTKIVDAEQVPVIAFGLKADFRVIRPCSVRLQLGAGNAERALPGTRYGHRLLRPQTHDDGPETPTGPRLAQGGR